MIEIIDIKREEYEPGQTFYPDRIHFTLRGPDGQEQTTYVDLGTVMHSFLFQYVPDPEPNYELYYEVEGVPHEETFYADTERQARTKAGKIVFDAKAAAKRSDLVSNTRLLKIIIDGDLE